MSKNYEVPHCATSSIVVKWHWRISNEMSPKYRIVSLARRRHPWVAVQPPDTSRRIMPFKHSNMKMWRIQNVVSKELQRTRLVFGRYQIPFSPAVSVVMTSLMFDFRLLCVIRNLRRYTLNASATNMWTGMADTFRGWSHSLEENTCVLPPEVPLSLLKILT
jgi:hypothetical protein